MLVNKKIIVSCLALCIAGCSANSLTRGAESVRLTNKEPGRECTFIGDTTGNQGNFFTGGWTSNKNLETGARNDLKNNAYQMGGNVVYLLTQRAGVTGTGSVYGGGSSEQTNVTLTGNVYKCP